MARLHEYQGKALLARHGIKVPAGAEATSAQQAEEIARKLAKPVVVKIQAWTTGRAGIDGIAFADTPADASAHAAALLQRKVGGFPVTHVLVEERIDIARELFVSLLIDERSREPNILLSLRGGSGVEERAQQVCRVRCDVVTGPDRSALQRLLESSDLPSNLQQRILDATIKVFELAKAIDARSIEINPLAITDDGELVAADCRITIDDAAASRHPELGIEIARELDHPPTQLERIAYSIEQEDHRGTFFFAQLASVAPAGSRGLVGFHGAGGGGSMMSMDALVAEGFAAANFTDTSGNPSAAKVYRAARIVLAQPNLVGYFGSGSGVASQEQFWSAYGLAKAFWELNLDIPAVIRLGGNTEDRAVEILQTSCADLPAPVEGYKKTDTPAFIAKRFAELISASGPHAWQPRKPRRPAYVGSATSFSFAIRGGRVWIDSNQWRAAKSVILANAFGLLRDVNDSPALAVSETDISTKDSELIACEVESRRAGVDAIFVNLDIRGLDDLICAAMPAAQSEAPGRTARSSSEKVSCPS